MLTISLMFGTDSACFLVDVLADPYVRQQKHPPIHLITLPFDVSAARDYIRGWGPSVLDISLSSRNACSQKHTHTMAFPLPRVSCGRCRSCRGLNKTKTSSSWALGKDTFASFLPLLVSASAERNERQDFDVRQLIILAIPITATAATCSTSQQ